MQTGLIWLGLVSRDELNEPSGFYKAGYILTSERPLSSHDSAPWSYSQVEFTFTSSF
jgi:hypothetical protein